MPTERSIEIQSGGSGVGIREMWERLRQFNGDINIESDSSGTRIFDAIPSPISAIKKVCASFTVGRFGWNGV